MKTTLSVALAAVVLVSGCGDPRGEAEDQARQVLLRRERVGAGSPPSLEASGQLSVIATPPALVYLDGVLEGRAGPEYPLVIRAAAGHRELQVQRTGYMDHVSTIRFDAGRERQALVTLTPLAGHHPQVRRARQLRVGGTVHGALSSGDCVAADLYRLYGVSLQPGPAYLDVVELVDLPEIPLELTAAAVSAKIRVRIFNAQHELVAEGQDDSWVHNVTFTPPTSPLILVVENRNREKNDNLDLCRYTLLLRIK